MALGFPKFRVRSPNRDFERDMKRFDQIEGAIREAIESAKLEHDGLQRRVSDALYAAISVMDNSGDYEKRDPRDEELIVKFEETAKSGQQRLEALDRQRAAYEQLLADLAQQRPQLRE